MQREIYSVKVYSGRMDYDAFRFELTPQQNEEENDYWGMNFTVSVFCRGQMCARIWGKLYDENRVYGGAMDILNVADPYGPEETALAEAFNGCPELCVRQEEWKSERGFSGYLQGGFVEPAFRGRGIAGYLLKNLHHILYHAMNIKIRAVGASPMPVAEIGGDVVEDAAQLSKNRTLLEKCGFHEILDESMSAMAYGNYDDEDIALGTGYFVRVYPLI